MRPSVQKCRSHLGISEDLRSFGKAQIGRDHNAGALIEFGKQVKQQRAACLAKRQVAQLVEYHQVNVHQLERNLTSFAMRFFLLDLPLLVELKWLKTSPLESGASLLALRPIVPDISVHPAQPSQQQRRLAQLAPDLMEGVTLGRLEVGAGQ